VDKVKRFLSMAQHLLKFISSSST